MACKHDCVCKPFRQAIAHPAQRQGQGKRYASFAPLTQSVMCRGKVNDTATHNCSPPPSSAFSVLLKSPWLVVVEAFLPIHNRAVLYIYVYDLLGYGLSERPWNPAIDTSVTGQVSVLKDLLEHWRLTDLHIVAHDIGGGIAQRFAIESPSACVLCP